MEPLVGQLGKILTSSDDVLVRTGAHLGQHSALYVSITRLDRKAFSRRVCSLPAEFVILFIFGI